MVMCIYGTPHWSSLCLRMSEPLTVLGHQQAQYWLQRNIPINLLAINIYEYLLPVQTTLSKMVDEISRYISWLFESWYGALCQRVWSIMNVFVSDCHVAVPHVPSDFFEWSSSSFTALSSLLKNTMINTEDNTYTNVMIFTSMFSKYLWVFLYHHFFIMGAKCLMIHACIFRQFWKRNHWIKK